MPITKQTELEQDGQAHALTLAVEELQDEQGRSQFYVYGCSHWGSLLISKSILQDDSVNNHKDRNHTSHIPEINDYTQTPVFTNSDTTSSNSPNYNSDKDIIHDPNLFVESQSCDDQSEHLNEDSSVPSILSQAKTSITTAEMKSSNLEPGLQRDAENGLSYLTASFAEGRFDDPDIYSNVKHFRRQREVFFVPEKAEGERMIQIFIAGIERGKPFFTMPPIDIIPKLAFEPKTISERAWLLLYNAFLSATIAFMEPSNNRINRGLQWNVWMMLQDFSFFLEPSVISIQAILMVSTHSQDLVPPGLCWTLISHACRMAQSLNLHVPSPKYPKKSNENSQRNCLFWNLFMIDKSLSLAFGRPPFLSSRIYEGVDPPDPAFLATFRPHRPSARDIGTLQQNPLSDAFGALYFALARELFVLQGKIIDIALLIHNGESETGEISEMKQKLEIWKDSLDERMSAYNNFQGESSEIQSIEIGINFLIFQYHHSVVYLTRSSKQNHELCLFSARVAIKMLEKLVQNSNEVFNGILWQLLYYPFMPYFVLFCNIIADPHSPKCFEDLQLLRKVVYFFLRMHTQHRSARKLEQIAETFTRLAESFVRGSIHRKSLEGKLSEVPIRGLESTSLTDGLVPQTAHELGGGHSARIDAPNFNSYNHDFPLTGTNLRDLSSDLADPTLLSFLSYPMEISGFANEIPGDISMREMGSLHEQAGQSADPLLHQLDFLSTEQSLDGNFDWFSWDTYAWNAAENGI
ncbi:hypothetical protein SBOR_8481 [Sclerotinia borealis F-4128]|uniref:Xylanolytic transcriptional activator regulatory domain-containing protein n=1 Tax=Sclerotinia borealis (strain F-4128) TaxID=1432307 RepID=W9C2X9_SCLBF|nr:hypothetical protein SBOR_8481 [Sclerotinia borealis F-4128]